MRDTEKQPDSAGEGARCCSVPHSKSFRTLFGFWLLSSRWAKPKPTGYRDKPDWCSTMVMWGDRAHVLTANWEKNLETENEEQNSKKVELNQTQSTTVFETFQESYFLSDLPGGDGVFAQNLYLINEHLTYHPCYPFITILKASGHPVWCMPVIPTTTDGGLEGKAWKAAYWVQNQPRHLIKTFQRKVW